MTVALLFAGAEQGSAQSEPPAQAPPVHAGPQAGTPATPQPEPPATPRTKRQRQTKRAPRTTSRRPSSASPGSSEGARHSRDAGPSREELILTANVLGGYDDNLTASLGTGAGAVPTAPASGYTGFLDARLDYFRGTTLRSIRVGSGGSLRTYPGYLDSPAPGGLATIEGTTALGRKHTLRVSERVEYLPLFTAGVIGVSGVAPPPLTGEGSPATAGALPSTGLFERQSWISDTAVSLERNWTRRDTTRVSYDYFTQRFTSDEYGDNHYNQATAEYRRRLERGVTLRTSYRYLDGNYSDYAGDTYPRTEQTVEGGPDFVKMLHGQRRLWVSLGAGATWVEGVNTATHEPYDDWVPTASAAATFDLTNTWWLRGDYRRGFTVLQGLTDQLYSTDTASVRTGGPLFARTEVAVGGSFADGRTNVASGASDTFRVYGASLVLSTALTPTVAAFAGYFYYDHRYSNPAELPTGFPARYDRNAFRVGVTFFVPLVGTSLRRPATPGIRY